MRMEAIGTERMDAEDSNLKAKANFSQASMTVSELNNFLISLIKPLKSARVRVINHLSKMLKKLRASKNPPDIIDKKAANLLQEIREVKALIFSPHFIKNLVCKQYTEKDLSKASAVAERAVIRLALQPSQFTAAIDKFRKEHSDWEELIKFLESKNTARRFRKKNAKKSTEKLAKSTLDTADKLAKEKFVANDQSHQRNKRPVQIKPVEDERVSAGNVDISEKTDAPDPSLSNKNNITSKPDTWLCSIFKSKNEQTTANAGSSIFVSKISDTTESHINDAESEGVVVKLDPKLLRKAGKADASLPIAFEKRVSKEKKHSELLDTEGAKEEFADGFDFFMPIDSNDNDEISRPGGNIPKIPIEEEQVNDKNWRSNAKGRGRGRGNFNYQPSRGRGREFAGRGGFHGTPRFGLSSVHQQRNSAGGGHQQFGSSSDRLGAAPAEKLHASWEARRQQRDEQKIKIPAAGQTIAKKITFNEED